VLAGLAGLAVAWRRGGVSRAEVSRSEVSRSEVSRSGGLG